MTITDFLLARIAEDEAAANECLLPKNLHPYGDMSIPAIDPSEWGDLAKNYLGGEMGEHCANWNPARVLAECAAKRAIIELHQPTLTTVEWFDDTTGTGHSLTCPSCRPEDPTDWHPPMGMAGIRPEGFVPHYTLAPCPTLRALAAVYKDHPDYQQEWA